MQGFRFEGREKAFRRANWWGEAPERPNQIRSALGFRVDVMGYAAALAEA